MAPKWTFPFAASDGSKSPLELSTVTLPCLEASGLHPELGCKGMCVCVLYAKLWGVGVGFSFFVLLLVSVGCDHTSARHAFN